MEKQSQAESCNLQSEVNAPQPAPSNQFLAPDMGIKLTFDNIDYKQVVHHMTEDNQNIDKHCVTVMCTENRVSGNHLSDTPSQYGVIAMENGKCVPSSFENTKQRENYITLVERIIVNHISCLGFLQDVITPHIPHCYSTAMSKKTDTVSFNLGKQINTDNIIIQHVLMCKL